MVLLASFTLPLYGSGAVSLVDRLGPVYPIIEPDWSTWLPKEAERRLRERPSFSREQVRETIKRKMPEIDLPEVKVSRKYKVDPSVRIGWPVSDHTGRILIPAGSRVNPLERLPTIRPIVIIDGLKKKQVAWAARLRESPLVLITAGDIFDLSQQFGRPVYPAPKALIERFAIERVPVVLSSRNGMIAVEEVALP